MRTIVIGSGLINLATAYRLSEMGYEVTIIETSPIAPSKKGTVETQLFRLQLESKIRHVNISFRRTCIVDRFIIKNNRIRGVVIRNEHKQPEVMMADLCISTLDHKDPVLKSHGISSPSHFKPLKHGQFTNTLIGKSRFSNLYVNIENGTISPSLASQTAKQLADFIYNPSSSSNEYNNQPAIFQGTPNFIFSIFEHISGMLHRLFVQ